MIVQDMTHMANFVYNYYMERAKLMKEYYDVSVYEFKFVLTVTSVENVLKWNI